MSPLFYSSFFHNVSFVWPHRDIVITRFARYFELASKPRTTPGGSEINKRYWKKKDINTFDNLTT